MPYPVSAVRGKDFGASIPTFNFNPTLATFTAAMSKRTAPGPFAACPICQGEQGVVTKRDSITANYSTITGDFRTLFDARQGTVSLWLTPEWGGNDNLNHGILAFSGTINRWFLVKTNTNALLFVGGDGSASTSISTASWVAGTTYHIVFRWDANKPIDGTNHMCLSINDSHAFGSAGVNVNNITSSTLYVGAAGNGDVTGIYAADSLVEGLTIYRRVLYDGTYGTNVGNGDELALIYNAGAGTDPTLITGSWDVTFCLPTDAATGTLSTGTGQAWSHPHSTAALIDTYCQTAYASSAWDDKGSPITPISYNMGSTVIINAGSGASLDNLHDAEFTAEAWIRRSAGGVNNTGMIICKNGSGASIVDGWGFYTTPTMGLYAVVQCATTDATSNVTIGNSFGNDNRWHHVVMYFNDAGDRKIYLAVDGVWVSSYNTQTAGVGVIQSDVANNLTIGASQNPNVFNFQGAIGWLRLSNNDRYSHSTSFTPPSRTSPPASDGNTVEQWNMDEGTGATAAAQVSTPTNDGVITNGSWNAVKDLATDAPGSRIFNWGYVFGASADGDGIEQPLTALTVGQNYVVRLLAHSQGQTGNIRLRVYDDTNGADLLSYTFGSGSTSLVPGVAIVTFELPTVARNGVGADCTAITISIEGVAAGQTVFMHQYEVQPNLVDNPSAETGSGDPWIPSGWSHSGLDAGDTVQEATIIHSGASSLEAATGAAAENVTTVIGAVTSGGFYGFGGWGRSVADTNKIRLSVSDAVQNDGSSAAAPLSYVIDGVAGSWRHKAVVFRATSTGSIPGINFGAGSTNLRYVDDVYVYALTPVTLTVTPASLANSQESAGVRVDGRDTLKQTVAGVTVTQGKIRFDITPRHSSGLFRSFFDGGDPRIMTWRFDANNEIVLDCTAANTIRLIIRMSGTTQSGSWSPTAGQFAAGTTYLFEIEYNGGGSGYLYVDGVVVITLAGLGSQFATLPTTLSLGAGAADDRQLDAVFGAP